MKRIHRRLPRPAPRDPVPANSGVRLRARLAGARRLLTHLGYLGGAWVLGGPGLAFHARVVALCGGLLARSRSPRARALALQTLAFPMEAVRYFEFGTVWSWAADRHPPVRMLDVSSPRLFPLLLAHSSPTTLADLVNPDPADLGITREWVEVLGLGSRCTLHGTTVARSPLVAGTYDLVTSISVLEHIPSPADLEAIERLWGFVRPGGRLILTVPCAREAFDEYVDLNEYGLLDADDRGFVFGQRFYDDTLLQECVLSVCGPPRRMLVLGERRPGTAFADRDRKLLGRADLAREPFAASRDYACFPSIESMPGVGVAALEFEKAAPP